jgi:hypothetical protein
MEFAHYYIANENITNVVRSKVSTQKNNVRVDIYGGPYLLVGLSPEQCDGIVNHFTGRCNVEIDVDIDKAPGVKIQVKIVDQKNFKPAYYPNGENSMEFDYGDKTVWVAGVFFIGKLDLTFERISNIWVGSESGFKFTEIIENFLRVVVAYRILANKGVMLHSAGLNNYSEGYIFFGKSGAGKSTISGLAAQSGFEIVSDDLNALIPGEDGVGLHMLPFTGDYKPTSVSSDTSALRGIFQLKQADENKLTAVSDGFALQALMVCCPFINQNPYCSDLLISNLERIIESVPVLSLRFTNNHDFLPLLKNWIHSE